MKKITMMFFVSFVVFSLSACGKPDTTVSAQTDNNFSGSSSASADKEKMLDAYQASIDKYKKK